MVLFSFGRTILLTDMLHVPSIRKNLVFDDKLNKASMCRVIELDKIVISRKQLLGVVILI